MKFHRCYVINGIPADEYYYENATSLDHFQNEEYWLMSDEGNPQDSNRESHQQELDLSEKNGNDLPF